MKCFKHAAQECMRPKSGRQIKVSTNLKGYKMLQFYKNHAFSDANWYMSFCNCWDMKQHDTFKQILHWPRVFDVFIKVTHKRKYRKKTEDVQYNESSIIETINNVTNKNGEENSNQHIIKLPEKNQSHDIVLISKSKTNSHKITFAFHVAIFIINLSCYQISSLCEQI